MRASRPRYPPNTRRGRRAGSDPGALPAAAAQDPLADSHWDFLTGDRERDRRNVHILLDSIEELYGAHALDAITRSAVDRAILVTGAECGMLLLDEGLAELQLFLARDAQGNDLPLDVRYSRCVVQKVWSTGEPTVMCDSATDPDLTQSIYALQLLSVMAVPLPTKGRSLGVLYVHSKAAVREFTGADFSVLQALGGFVALAVENARLLAEEAEQERLKRELHAAQEIQQHLLPKTIPQPEGFDIAGVSRPCEETSGDYFDVIPFNGGRVALVVGDVSGHGLGPAMLMASTCALLTEALITRPDPSDVMRCVNVFLERKSPEDTFMTLFFGALDPARREFRYVSAGHNPPLLLSPGGGLEELEKTGPALGVHAGAAYRLTEPRALESGQVLVLYTDGIHEAKDGVGEMYGEERFQASLRRHARPGAPARSILDGLLGDLRQFIAGHPLADDVTCLVVRVL